MGKPPASHSLTTKAPYRCVYIMRNGCFPSELLGGEAGIKCLLNAGCVQSQFLVGAFSKGQGLPCLGPIVSSHKL